MSIQIRAVVLSLLLACAPGATSAQTITLKYGQAYSALRSIFALPLLVAEREGYFADRRLGPRGLDRELKEICVGPRAFRQGIERALNLAGVPRGL